MIRMMHGWLDLKRGGKTTPLLLFCGVLGTAGCPAPGQGAKAEAGYRRAAPIIAALARYQRERGTYPDTLASLPADWLPAAGNAALAGPPLQYVRRDGQYELLFSYGGPGINHCVYATKSEVPAQWHCSGLY